RVDYLDRWFAFEIPPQQSFNFRGGGVLVIHSPSEGEGRSEEQGAKRAGRLDARILDPRARHPEAFGVGINPACELAGPVHIGKIRLVEKSTIFVGRKYRYCGSGKKSLMSGEVIKNLQAGFHTDENPEHEGNPDRHADEDRSHQAK